MYLKAVTDVKISTLLEKNGGGGTRLWIRKWTFKQKIASLMNIYHSNSMNHVFQILKLFHPTTDLTWSFSYEAIGVNCPVEYTKWHQVCCCERNDRNTQGLTWYQLATKTLLFFDEIRWRMFDYISRVSEVLLTDLLVEGDICFAVVSGQVYTSWHHTSKFCVTPNRIMYRSQDDLFAFTTAHDC